MRFKKMHGCGNDFVIIDQQDIRGMLTSEQVREICDRHFGVGCDQLVLLEVSRKADVFARFYNADGSEAGACGNATRCVAEIVMQEIKQESCVIETASGLLHCRRVDELIEVDMGPAYLGWKDIPLAEEVDTLDVPIAYQSDLSNPVAVGMGNPHCIFFVEELRAHDIERLGATYEIHQMFPQRTNVGFVQITGINQLRLRTWERGVGMTLACGTNACAAGVAAVRKDLTGRKVDIEVDGGQLQIEYREEDGHVLMTGPATHVFDGKIKNL